MATEIATPKAARPLRRRRWIRFFLFAAAAWWAARWWAGSLDCTRQSLALVDGDAILGYSEDGRLLDVHWDRDFHMEVGSRERPNGPRTVLWPTDADSCRPGVEYEARLSQDGRWLFLWEMGVSDDQVQNRVLDLRSGEIRRHTKRGVAWLSADGQILFVDDRERGIDVSELETGRSLGRIDESWIDAVSPDGQWVAAESAREMRLWKRAGDHYEATDLKLSAPDAIPTNLGSIDSEDRARNVRFSEDGQRFVAFGRTFLKAIDLSTLEVQQEWQDLDFVDVSADGRVAYASDGSSRTIATGEAVLGEVNSPTFFSGVSSGRRPWSFAIETGTLDDGLASYGGRRIDLGPYTIIIQNRDWTPEQQYALYNVESGERLNVPARFLPHDDQFTNWRLFTSRNRVAIWDPNEAVLTAIELPPRRPWAKQIGIALALFALPGWWCWRGKKVSAAS